MPIAGKGMLLTSMNVDAADEAEFNRWYDREHLEERVAIPGFLEARRYVAHDGNRKYLRFYYQLPCKFSRTWSRDERSWLHGDQRRFFLSKYQCDRHRYC